VVVELGAIVEPCGGPTKPWIAPALTVDPVSGTVVKEPCGPLVEYERWTWAASIFA
jgi:hypothetical protein